MNKFIYEANTFHLLAANFIVQSYVSDDVFVDFRAWLISQGREKYESAVKAPEVIADWFSRDMVDDMRGGDFYMMPQDAYLKRHGASNGSEEADDLEEDFFELYESYFDQDIELDWPDSKEDFHKQFPKLFDAFWNQDRINDIHK